MRTVRENPPGKSGRWSRVAGDGKALHHFSDTQNLAWWRAADCGAGPAVGDDKSDAALGSCSACEAATSARRDQRIGLSAG
jgi:hypothetical protein